MRPALGPAPEVTLPAVRVDQRERADADEDVEEVELCRLLDERDEEAESREPDDAPAERREETRIPQRNDADEQGGDGGGGPAEHVAIQQKVRQRHNRQS